MANLTCPSPILQSETLLPTLALRFDEYPFIDDMGHEAISWWTYAQFDVSQGGLAKFGMGGFSTSNDLSRVVIADSPDWDFGSGDFTIDMWVFTSNGTRSGAYLTRSLGYTTYPAYQLGQNYGGQVFFKASSNGNDLDVHIVSPFGGDNSPFIPSGWHHVEVDRVGDVFTLYVNGVVIDSATFAGALASGAGTGNKLNVGAEYGNAGPTYINGAGNLDEVRIIKGRALHTGPFTPPAISFGYSTVGPDTGSVSIAPPSPRLTFKAHDSFGEQSALLKAPRPTLSIYGGGNASKLKPARPTLQATGTVVGWGSANLTAPSPAINVSGTVSAMAGASLTAPSPNLIGYGGAVCSITLTGKARLQAVSVVGSVVGAYITAPLFELASSGTAQNYGSASLLAPSPKLGATIQAWLIAPSGRLTAIGSAVITATYEAYAVNLKHSNPDASDEVTHYTNFPFTHVVRYKNSYYGANSTGLYLLEGTTDDATPITFAVKTAMTDFKSPTKKTLASAYFGGRFGPASTVQLHAGEQTPNSYSYSTPRDTLAQNYRQVFGKGIKERYYAMSVSGTGTLELDSIELDVHNLTRRI